MVEDIKEALAEDTQKVLKELRHLPQEVKGAFWLIFGSIDRGKPYCPNCRHNYHEWCWRFGNRSTPHAKRICTPHHSCKYFVRR